MRGESGENSIAAKKITGFIGEIRTQSYRIYHRGATHPSVPFTFMQHIYSGSKQLLGRRDDKQED
jgi:hypothetical protein